MKRLIAGALVVFSLAACSGGGDLAKSDPKGAEACSRLAEAFKQKDHLAEAMALTVGSGTSAAEAKTESIRNAVVDMGTGDKAADAEKMHDACVAAGVDMPDVPR